MAYDPRKWYSYSNLYDQTTDVGVSCTPFSTIERNEDLVYKPHISLHEHTEEANNAVNKYIVGSLSVKQEKEEYDPCAPAISKRSEEEKYIENKLDPRKLECYITTLQKLIRPIPSEYKKKLPYDVICQLAHAILDGTVFEIAKGLLDIQQITEKNLSDRRTTIVNEHKVQKADMMKRQQNEIVKSQSRPHQILVLEKQHTEEKKVFQHRYEKELINMDKKLVLEFDQQVSDQQATLQRAGLPLFYITNKPEDVKLQMYILEFVIKLASN